MGAHRALGSQGRGVTAPWVHGALGSRNLGWGIKDYVPVGSGGLVTDTKLAADPTQDNVLNGEFWI